MNFNDYLVLSSLVIGVVFSVVYFVSGNDSHLIATIIMIASSLNLLREGK